MTPPASRSSTTAQLESVRAVGNLERAARRAGRAAAPRAAAVAARRARADHRHRPHPLGHPRPRHRGQRPPALRRRRARARRGQRHRRELHGAQAGARSPTARRSRSETDAEVVAHLIARGIDDGDDLVEAVRARLQPPARPLRVRRGRRRRARRCSSAPARSARWSSAAARASSSSPPASPPSSPHTRDVQLIEDDEIVVVRRDGVEFLTADGEPIERDGRDGRLGRRGGREGRLRDVHAQGDPRAGGRGRRDDRRPHRARPDGVDLPSSDDRRRLAARLQPDRHRRLRHLLPRRA